MRISWLFTSFGFWLRLLVALVGLSLIVSFIRIGLAPYENLALRFEEPIGDFYVDEVISDQTITQTHTLLVTPNCLIVPSTTGSLSCMDSISGSAKWQTFLTDALVGTPLFVSRHRALFLTHVGGGLQMVSEKTGETVWKFKDLDEFNWKQTLISADQRLVALLNTRNQVFVFELSTGKLLWKTELDPKNFIEPKTKITIHDDKLYVADSAAHTLTSFAFENGVQLWRQTTYTDDVNATVEFVGDLVWHETNFYSWQGVDAHTGAVKAKLVPPPGSVMMNLGHALAFHNYGNQVFWFDAQTGAALETTKLAGKIQKIWFDQQLFVKLASAPFAENLTAVNTQDHSVLWTSEALQIIKNVTVLSENLLLATSLNGQVTWIKTQTGETVAKTWVQGTPLLTLKKSETDFWLITTHHGNFSENSAKELIDVWFFEKVGEVALQIPDLPVIGATGVLMTDRLWLVNQAQNLVVGLTQKPLQRDVRFWLRTEFPVSVLERLKSKLLRYQLMLSPEKNQFFIKNSVSQNFQGCVITSEVIPENHIVQKLLRQPSFNLWQDVRVAAVLEKNGVVIAQSKGYYYLPNQWNTTFLAPPLTEFENLTITTTFTIAGITLTKNSPVTVPPNCTTNFITLSPDKKTLQTPDQKMYWGLGIQDVMLDFDQTGSVFDNWRYGESVTPNFEIPLAKHSFKTYLQHYRQAGYSLFRISQDNFSFKNWLSFSENDFRASLHTGLITDEFLRQLRSENYRIVFGIFGFTPETESDAVAAYLDYCIARFGPWIDIWEISNEAWPDESWVTFVSEYLKTHDPYQHPVTTNWDRSNLASIDLVNLHYYRSEPASELTAEFLSTINNHRSTNKPILFGEFGNSGTNWDHLSVERLRLKTWLSAWQRTPLIIWNESGTAAHNRENANLYMGPAENDVTRKLVGWLGEYEGIDLQPFEIKTTSGNFCSGLTNTTSLVLIYCTNSSGSHKTEVFKPAVVLDAARIANSEKKWRVTWFDPQTLQEISTAKINLSSTENITAPAFISDVVSEWRVEP